MTVSQDCSLLDGSAEPPVELSPPEDRDNPNRLESSLLPPDPEPPDPALLYYFIDFQSIDLIFSKDLN